MTTLRVNGAVVRTAKLLGQQSPDGALIHRACGSNKAPWLFKMAGPLCAIATSPVTEGGMDWWRNGNPKPRQSPHYEFCDYSFHGTYNPADIYDHVRYKDVLKFEIPDGDAELTVHGDFTLVGPCSPTSCRSTPRAGSGSSEQ